MCMFYLIFCRVASFYYLKQKKKHHINLCWKISVKHEGHLKILVSIRLWLRYKFQVCLFYTISVPFYTLYHNLNVRCLKINTLSPFIFASQTLNRKFIQHLCEIKREPIKIIITVQVSTSIKWPAEPTQRLFSVYVHVSWGRQGGSLYPGQIYVPRFHWKRFCYVDILLRDERCFN